MKRYDTTKKPRLPVAMIEKLNPEMRRVFLQLDEQLSVGSQVPTAGGGVVPIRVNESSGQVEIFRSNKWQGLTIGSAASSVTASTRGASSSSSSNLNLGADGNLYHNSLSGLQGGASNDYQHLTSAQVAKIHDPATVADTGSIDLTISGQEISGVVLPGGVDHNSLANLSVGDPHTQYVKKAGDTMTGALLINLASDVEGLVIEADASQTNNLLVIRAADDTDDLVTVSKDGYLMPKKLGVGTFSAPYYDIDLLRDDADAYSRIGVVGDYIPYFLMARSSGVSKANATWKLGVGSAGNLLFVDYLNNKYPLSIALATEQVTMRGNLLLDLVSDVEGLVIELDASQTNHALNVRLAGDSGDVFYIDSSGQMRIGQYAMTTYKVESIGDDAATGQWRIARSSTTGGPPGINFAHSKGTPSSKAATVAENWIGGVFARGYGDTNYVGDGCGVVFKAKENHTDSAGGNRIGFYTQANGSTSWTFRVYIDDGGITLYNSGKITPSSALNSYTPDNESTPYTGLASGLPAFPYASVTDLNALRVAYENLRTAFDDWRSKLMA